MQIQGFETTKGERISLRIDSPTKELIEQAAAIDHRSLTGFILACAKERAEQVIERESTVRLKKEEWDRFMKVLENPPKPNASLRKLMREVAG